MTCTQGATTAALLDLTETLSGYGADDNLVGQAWLMAVAEALMANPFGYGHDPYLYNALLSWAGFEPTDNDPLRDALVEEDRPVIYTRAQVARQRTSPIGDLLGPTVRTSSWSTSPRCAGV